MAVGPLQDKIKEAVGKLTTASNALVTAERDFKKTELTRSIAAHELVLAHNSLTNAMKTLSNTVATLEKAEAAEKRRESSLGRAKERAANAEAVTRAICFSPDNLTLATLDDAYGIHTWSLESGEPIEVYHPTNGPVLSLSFSAPGQLEALSRTHLHRWKTMPVWKLTRAVGSPDGDSPFADRVNCVRFSRDGKFFATGGGEPSRMGEIKVWKTDTGELFRDLSTIHSDSVFSLDFSPDGKLLASGAADKFLRVSSLETGKQVKTFEGHTHHVLGVSWKADGRALASAGADSMLKTWNAVTGERIKNIEGFGKEVTAASFLGVTGQVLAAAGDGQLRLVKENGDNVRSFSGATDFLYAAAATPDGKLVVAAGLDGVLRVWNGEDGKLEAEFAP